MNFKLKPFRGVTEVGEQFVLDAVGQITGGKFILFLGAISFPLPTVEAGEGFAVLSEGEYPLEDGFMLQINQEGPSPGYTLPGCELCLVFPQQPHARESRSIPDGLPSMTEVNLLVPLPLKKSISFYFAPDGTYNGSGSVAMGPPKETDQARG